jgi:hypothetical protein
MGLSDEGLILVLVFTWVPVLALHAVILHRAWRLGNRGALSEYNKNLVTLVTFILVIALYTVGCTATIYAALSDRETDRSAIALIAETVWLASPVLGTITALVSNHPWLASSCFKVFPATRVGWKLAARRAFIFGIPFCFVFSSGDQILRQAIAMIATGDPNSPIPMNQEFLTAVGTAFGYAGSSNIVNMVLGFLSNFTIGPFIDLFAPASDSVYEYNNAGMTGIASYFVYAIPEEIGWTGTLYPLLLSHFSYQRNSRWIVGKSVLLTGVIWGLWHVPFIVLKANQDLSPFLGMTYNFLFLLSCIATRAVLVSLVWPALRPTSHLLRAESEEEAIKPSLLPAVFAHAALNVWWNFFNLMYLWKDAQTWSICTGSEFSVLAVGWQFALAFLIFKASWKRSSSTSITNQATP